MKSLVEAEKIAGSLSEPGKMPCWGYGISPHSCKTGSKLKKIKGSVCSTCYAHRGNYAYSCVTECHAKRMKNLGTPLWVGAMTYMIDRKAKNNYFRWHDSGDVQSLQHLVSIVQIAEKLPKINFWLPTKERKITLEYMDIFGVVPKNLTIRMSAAMIDSETVDDEITGCVSYVQHKTALNGKFCKAYSQGGKCKDCRDCWNKNIKAIIYPKH